MTSENINFFIATMIRNGHSAADAHRYLKDAWGEENVIKERRVREIAQEFKAGRNDFTRLEGSGRPSTVSNDGNIKIVNDIIMEDNCASLGTIEKKTNINRRSVQRIIHENLNMKSVSGRWVPHKLLDLHKEKRIEAASNIIPELSRRNAYKNVYVADEKWVYLSDSQHVNNLHKWVAKDGSGDQARPMVPRLNNMTPKCQIIVVCNFNCQFYFEVLQDGSSINSKRYIDFCQNALEHFGLGVIERHNILWMHDNAPPHRSRETFSFFEQSGIKLLKQPPYSPDFNLQDRFIFRNYTKVFVIT